MPQKKAVPWNKGLKGWTEGTKAGFQKGHPNYHTEESRRKIGDFNRGKRMAEETKKKISMANTGKESWNKGKIAWNRGIPMSKEAKEKQRSAHTGPKNSQWVDGRSLLPYSKSWRKIRKEIFELYERKCQLCNEQFVEKKLRDKNFITAHHIDYNTQNNDRNNLIALCNLCNVYVNKNRDFWKELFSLIKSSEIPDRYDYE